MNRFALAVSTLSLLLGCSVLAQAPPAPPRCDTAEHGHFDFWVGDWKVESPAGQVLGTNRISKILNDCVLQERWVGAGGFTGESFNVWDRSTGKWHQTWVDGAGSLLLLDGGLDGKSMRMEGKGKDRAGAPIVQRITWTPLEAKDCAGCVRQFWEQSADGGKSWTVAFEGIYKPLTAKGAAGD